MRRAAGPCVRALCDAVAQMLSKNMTCARSRRNATPSKHFLTLHTALFTLHTCTSHPALQLISDHASSSHLISPHLSSSHLIPFPLTCHLRKFFSTVFIPSEHWSTFLISSNLFSTHLSCSARQKALTVSTQKLETQMHLHFTQENLLESIFVLQSLAHLPSSSVSQKSFVSTQKPLCKSTHMATPDDNNHAAIPMRSATTDSRNA